MTALKIGILSLGVLISAATALSLVRTDQWWIRAFDFPRLQLTALGLIVLVAIALGRKRLGPAGRWVALPVGAAMVIQAWQIFPYTRFASPQVLPSGNSEASLKVFVANVLLHNRESGKLLAQIATHNPDLILLNEPDARWVSELAPLKKNYPHQVLYPLTNTYGMLLYSKFELINPEVRFLTDDEIPSIRTKVRLPSDQEILFYGIHPRPPVHRPPDRKERHDSTQRDAELVLIAKEVANVTGPVIVAGDFNDVAWSHTTRLFQRISRLLDPRVGRGLYNSYHAKLPFLRFPLDHLFHSDDFKLVEMLRLGYFGSDHFPIVADLSLEGEAATQQEAPPQKPDDPIEAQDILQRKREE
jgi:endonuclease/exonuclease/phosphatase (EEP) superfamily protein YafD